MSSFKKIGTSLAVAVAVVGLSLQAQAVTIGFDSLPGGSIEFDDAGNFSFMGDPSFETDGGLEGSIHGVFSLGPITPIAIGVEHAPVTGSGLMIITDGDGEELIAALDWVDIGSVGPMGVVNISANVNLGTISYAGTDADLLALATDGAGIAKMGFFLPLSPFPLTEVTTLGGSSPFGGKIESVPTPTPVPDAGASILLLGLSLVGLGFFRKRA